MAVRYVEAEAMRQAFNQAQLYHRLLAGELEASARDESHLSRARAAKLKSPFCTRRQMVAYKEQGQLIAVVNQYLRPDGTLGASGLPDPKWLRVGDNIWKYRPRSRQ